MDVVGLIFKNFEVLDLSGGSPKVNVDTLVEIFKPACPAARWDENIRPRWLRRNMIRYARHCHTLPPRSSEHHLDCHCLVLCPCPRLFLQVQQRQGPQDLAPVPWGTWDFKIKAIGISTYVMSSCYLWSKSYVLYSSEKLIEFLHLVVKLCQQKTRILLRHRWLVFLNRAGKIGWKQEETSDCIVCTW